MGIYVSFILGIYPTALSFTSSLANDQYLIAFYATSVGVAEISGMSFLFFPDRFIFKGMLKTSSIGIPSLWPIMYFLPASTMTTSTAISLKQLIQTL